MYREYRYGFHSGRRETIFYIVLVVILGAAAITGLGIGMFVDPRDAIRTLEAQGYSDVEITHRAWFLVGFRGCDKSDAARFTAKATNPAGRATEVYVCRGAWFKGGTIRVK